MIIPIERVIRLPQKRGNYVDPPYLVLTNYPINPEDRVLTAVSWLIEGRPDSVNYLKPDTTVFKEVLKETMEAEINDQMLVFLGMAGIMTIAREIRLTRPSANTKYLTKRWQTLYDTMGIIDIITNEEISAEKLSHFMHFLSIWQVWIKSRTYVKKDILDQTLKFVPLTENPVIRAALQQARLVLQEFGMRFAIMILSFILSDDKAIILPAVASQAVSFKNTIWELRKQHKEKLLFTTLYPLKGVEKLHYKNFPDLYYVAITTVTANKYLEPEERSAIAEVETKTLKSTLDLYASKTLNDEFITKETRENLKFIGKNPEILGLRMCNDEDNDSDVEEQPQRKKIKTKNGN